MATIEQMQAQVTGDLAPTVAKVIASFRAVAAKEAMPQDLQTAARVGAKNGYFRWSSRAGRYMFTDKGTKFYKAMKRFS
jgi:hypothetical protein